MITNLFSSFYFQLSLSGEKETAFQDASGLSIEIKNEALLPSFRLLPFEAKTSNLVLKRGLVAQDSLLLQWCQRTIASDLSTSISTHTIFLELMNEQGERIMQWFFYDSWPIKFNIAGFEDDQIAVETLEFAYSHFDRS